MLFRVASHDTDHFGKIPSLEGFFDRLYLVFIEKEAHSSTPEPEFGEQQGDSRTLALLLLRLVRNERCRNTLLAHKEFDAVFVFLMKHFPALELTEGEIYSCILGLVNLSSSQSDLQRY